MSDVTGLVDEISNELDTWPGVEIGPRADGAAVIRYEDLELGVLDRDRGVAELGFSYPVREEVTERGDAEAADSAPDSDRVRHGIEGPSDVTAVLELLDRRYRDLRGEEDHVQLRGPGLNRGPATRALRRARVDPWCANGVG
jgi:hypothetical protein